MKYAQAINIDRHKALEECADQVLRAFESDDVIETWRGLRQAFEFAHKAKNHTDNKSFRIEAPWK